MQKRLKEIVIYILENGNSLEPGQRAQLEEMREQLRRGDFPLEEVESVIRKVLELDAEELIVAGSSLSEAAAGYLERLEGQGLIAEEQRADILQRAARLYPEGVGLADLQFLAASQIFDETLGVLTGWEGRGPGSEASLH